MHGRTGAAVGAGGRVLAGAGMSANRGCEALEARIAAGPTARGRGRAWERQGGGPEATVGGKGPFSSSCCGWPWNWTPANRVRK